MCIRDRSIDALTVIRRVNKGATNLNVIAQVNDISRKFYMRIISLEEAFSQLKHLKKSQYPWWLTDIDVYKRQAQYHQLI